MLVLLSSIRVVGVPRPANYTSIYDFGLNICMKTLREMMDLIESAQHRFDEPLSGWHIVYRNSGNPVHGTPSFETQDQAQKYLMTRMFANHHELKVVHTAGVGVAEGEKNLIPGLGMMLIQN